MEDNIGKKIRRLRFFTALLALQGIGLSAYSVYVGYSRTRDPDYRALCDISQKVTCSSVFLTKYGKGFGLVDQFQGKDSLLNQSNGVYGVLSYLVFFLLALTNNQVAGCFKIIFALIANLSSVYLGYILFIVLGDICLVCISTYIINFLLLIVVWKQRKLVNLSQEKDPLINGLGKKRV